MSKPWLNNVLIEDTRLGSSKGATHIHNKNVTLSLYARNLHLKRFFFSQMHFIVTAQGSPSHSRCYFIPIYGRVFSLSDYAQAGHL